jgi:hypothetical protein
VKFDRYDIVARLLPAILVVLPLWATALAWLPDLQSLKGLGGAGMGLMALGVLGARVARRAGKRRERALWCCWGGSPTTLALQHRSGLLDSHTRARYHRFLEAHVPDFRAPSIEDESNAPREADERYESATRWLREYTRDTHRFPLLFKENINYGFARNLWGLRIWGVLSCACALVTWISMSFLTGGDKPWDREPLPFAAAALGGLVLVVLVGWVTRGWVREAADSYARALLAVCDEVPGVGHRSAKEDDHG